MGFSLLSPLTLGLEWLVCGVLLTMFAGGSAQASKTRDAAILARVLSFELTLDERVGPSVGVAVIYKAGNKGSEANAEEWFQGLAALSSVKIKDRPFFAVKVPYKPNDLAATIDSKGIDVLLVADGLEDESDAIARQARAKHLLTASNTVSFVERNMTLCVTEQGTKTKITINLSTAQLEGIRFSSNLLKLATVIR